MIRVNSERAGRSCDGLSRRSFLQAGMGSIGLSSVLRARASSANPKDTSVIFIWLDGGPGHMDMYDMKPEAPVEYRGLWKPIKTNVPGIEVSPFFLRQAKCAHQFSIVRSLYHNTGNHWTGAHAILTSRHGNVDTRRFEGEYPGFGAIISKVRGPNRPGLPAYVAVPQAHSSGVRPGYHGGYYLGNAYNPFDVVQDPNSPSFQIQNLALAGNLTMGQLEDRKSLVAHFDQVQRGMEKNRTVEAMDRFQRHAYELVAGPAARRAFNLSTEDPKLRDRYGRHTWGQSLLLARRLVENGVTIVTAVLSGWDHHWNLEPGMKEYLPRLDAALESLLADLAERGLLERTLVVMFGEFSRTPKMNKGEMGGPGTPGRDHWGDSMFCFLAGGGIKGGRLVGSTDYLGLRPKDRPLTPGDLHATIYKVMGIDPAIHFPDHTGRPIPAIDHGSAIHELF